MMRRSATIAVTATVCLGLLTGLSTAAPRAAAAVRAAVSGGAWGSAEEVPGSGALNQYGIAEVNSVSCGSAGSCAAGGYYTDSSDDTQAFVATQTNGTWGNAEEVPGSAALNLGGRAAITSLSCASAGNCTGGGYYADGSFRYQVFVADETNGVWGTAEQIPGFAALNQGGNGLAGIESVSCASAGNCSVGGNYSDRRNRLQAFVASETNGVWGTAEEVPGSGALNKGGGAEVDAVSCGAPGNCSAGGDYTTNFNAGHGQAFVVSETNGVWGTVKTVAGALNTQQSAETAAVSCTSAGNCSAGGYYETAPVDREAFVINETNGVWGKAEEVPGSGALNTQGDAQLTSVSCASAGNCSAGGWYTRPYQTQAFLVSEKKGVWGKAGEVPGSAALNRGHGAQITAVSCASPGNCSAGGSYTDSSKNAEVFVVGEAKGVWGKAEEVPGSGALNRRASAWIFSLSCGSVDHCSAGGYYGAYSSHSQGQQAFVADET